jgi:hypothetical protein
MNESRDPRPFLDSFGQETCADALPGATVTDEADIRNEEVRLLGVTLQAGSD